MARDYDSWDPRRVRPRGTSTHHFAINGPAKERWLHDKAAIVAGLLRGTYDPDSGWSIYRKSGEFAGEVWLPDTRTLAKLFEVLVTHGFSEEVVDDFIAEHGP